MDVTCNSTKSALKIKLCVKLLKCLVAYQIHDLGDGKAEGRLWRYMQNENVFQHSYQRLVQASNKTS